MNEEKLNQTSKYSTERRDVYARWLDIAGRTGLILIAISFTIYLIGAVESHVPLVEIPSYWGLSASEYMKAVGYRGGWSWLSLVHKADYMNFVGVCFLASVTMICNMRLIPILIKEKDKALATICILQIIVIFLAASGIIASGH